MWGPWYVDIQWSAYHPAINLPPRSTISWLRAAAWHPTSKVIQKLIFLTEKKQLKVLHFTGAQLPDFRQQVSAYSDFLSMQDNLHMLLLYKLYQSPQERTLPTYQWGTLRTLCLNDPVCSQGEQQQEAGLSKREDLSWEDCDT